MKDKYIVDMRGEVKKPPYVNVKKELSIEDTGNMQRLFCKKRNDCIYRVIDRRWRSFSCEHCDQYEPEESRQVKRSSHFGASDIVNKDSGYYYARQKYGKNFKKKSKGLDTSDT